MKKIFVFILLFTSVIVSAQNNAAEDTTTKPAITAIGKPDGKIAEKMMNKDGGTLVSGDGNLELIIPSGALSKKTTISIQPITNMLPNGNGQSYRLEPSGIQFQKPLQLVFHYTPEESADSMQLLMGIAMQDNKGQWYSLNKFTLDTVAKTISGNISHFSDWSKFDAIKLEPEKARVKVEKTLALFISGVVPKPKDLDDEELSPLYRTKEPKKLIWNVNKIVGGNATFGTIKGIVGSTDKKLEYGFFAAPVVVPADQNPVAVSVKLDGLAIKFNGSSFNNLRLVSNLLIYDKAYEVKMISSINGMAGSTLGSVAYKDTGSFVVSLNGKDTKIIEKINKNAAASLNYTGQCVVRILKPGWGNIHIIKALSIKVTPPTSPTEPTWVEITFPFTATMFPLLQFTCPTGNKGGTFTGTNAQANAVVASIPAYPTPYYSLKFKAIEEEQTILLIGKEGDDIFAKFTVKQIKED